MSAPALTIARALALAGPTALAFFAGGYFGEARGWAGAGAWLGVALAAVGGARMPRSRPAALALGGLTLLAAWTLLSMLWAPIEGNAYHAGQIALLYLGTLLGSAMVFRGRAAARLLEPALAAGTLIVVGYGLSERMLPGLLHFTASVSAEGRLEQPLTYWNATGELAAIGLVLCVRMAGERTRSRVIRSRRRPRSRRSAWPSTSRSRAGPCSPAWLVSSRSCSWSRPARSSARWRGA